MTDLLPPLDDRPGPARPLDPAAEDRMVATALAAYGEGPVRAPRKSWRSRALAIAGVSLAASLAAAAGARWVWRAPPPPVVAAPPLDTPPPTPPAAPEARPSAIPDRGRPRRPAPRPPAPTAAEDALEVASRLRRARDYRGAERAYVGVIERHPGTTAAEVARIAAASLRLEHLADAKGALALYRAAAATPGRFGAEALLGLADAHRALGDRAAEREALLRLIAEHPESVEARAARRRVAEAR